MPLVSGAVPAEHIPAVMATLRNEIVHRQAGHIDTGLHGTYANKALPLPVCCPDPRVCEWERESVYRELKFLPPKRLNLAPDSVACKLPTFVGVCGAA